MWYLGGIIFTVRTSVHQKSAGRGGLDKARHGPTYKRKLREDRH